jgi:hypothetical protein
MVAIDSPMQTIRASAMVWLAVKHVWGKRNKSTPFKCGCNSDQVLRVLELHKITSCCSLLTLALHDGHTSLVGITHFVEGLSMKSRLQNTSSILWLEDLPGNPVFNYLFYSLYVQMSILSICSVVSTQKTNKKGVYTSPTKKPET